MIGFDRNTVDLDKLLMFINALNVVVEDVTLIPYDTYNGMM